MSLSYGNETSNWTEVEVRSYLSNLSLLSWYNRTPVVAYLTLLSVLGFAGNTLSFVVYHRRYRPSSTRVFVLSMSLCDLFINLLGLPLQITTIRYAYDSFNVTLCRTFYVFATIPTQASGFYLILVAYDRYRHICHPFSKQLSAGQTWRLVAAASVLALVLFLPFTPFYGWHSVDSLVPGVKAVMCWIHDPIRYTKYPLAYNIVVGFSLFSGVFLIAVCYLRIGIHVFQHQMKMKKFLAHDKSSNNATHKPPHFPRSDSITSTGHDSRKASRRESFPIIVSRDSCQEQLTQMSVSTISLNISLSCDLDEAVSHANTPPTPENNTTNAPSSDPAQNRGWKQSSARNEQKRVWNQKMTSARSSVNSMRAVRSRTTFMMAVLTGLYVLNWLPHFSMRIISNQPANMCQNLTDCGYNVYGLCIRSYFINSASNAFIYCICNPRFRQQCRLLLARKARV